MASLVADSFQRTAVGSSPRTGLSDNISRDAMSSPSAHLTRSDLAVSSSDEYMYGPSDLLDQETQDIFSHRRPSPDRLGFPRARMAMDSPSPLNLSHSRSPETGSDAQSKRANSLHPNLMSLSPPASWDIGGSSLARSVSADASIPPQGPSRLFSGLGGHSSLVENWRLERSNLDTLRRKAEKLYRDQQAVIDEMSDEWLREKTEMSELIQGLRERVHRLEGENSVLKSIAAHTSHVPGISSPQNSVQSGGFEAERGNFSPSHDLNKSPPHRPAGGAMALPPGLDGASRRPYYINKPPGSAATSPTGPPVQGIAQTMSPRTEPQNSIPQDFLHKDSPESTADIPVIDVQEIDPKLEGIPIKATAVQKSTFEPPHGHEHQDENHSQNTEPTTTQPTLSVEEPSPDSAPTKHKPRTDRRRSGLAPLAPLVTPGSEQAKQILATDETRRLTMHAGHTPNHSLSLFPTMTATENSSTAGRSQETTPTAWPSISFADHHAEINSDSIHGRAVNDEVVHKHDVQDQMDGADDEDVKEYFEPSDDAPLKGPLMIRNIPAQDEIFWAQVNQKLDPIARGGLDALPKVLQSPPLEAPEKPLGTQKSPDGGDHAPQKPKATAESDDEEGEGKPKVEPDVPLKFKSTSNFGAPFGST